MCGVLRFACLFMALLLLCGCSADKRQLENLGFTNSISYDLYTEEDNEERKLLVTTSVPNIGTKTGKQREVLTAVTQSSKQAWVKLSRQTGRILVNGQLRNALFGMELAAEGLMPHIDTLVRDPSIGQRVNIIIVDGKASELLKKDFPDEPPTGQYIYDLLEKEEKHNSIPDIAIYSFARDLMDEGIDPVAPIIKMNKDHLMIDGIALFGDDRYRTKVSFKDALIFAGLRGDLNQGELNVDFKDANEIESVTLSSVIGRRMVKVKRVQNGEIKVLLGLHFKGSVLEYIGSRELNDTKDIAFLEGQLSDYLQDEAMKLIRHMQTNQVDSLGIGQHVRNSMRYKEWNSLDWKEAYAGADIECSVKVTIINTGKFQ
ncbi:Ger(x)C family spore germination protein [Paenibacillus abyssi]|uniref:Germination protein XA n=1 Tax=Paenibacillus abyssi TaxID=1340531 RepID=A0A917D3S1_9BACL|nr:Ger(x)C family spore germination protein [Paenibacillus abyssi]GGG06118.1 germination protein XA [Paenibacillus abyssi]